MGCFNPSDRRLIMSHSDDNGLVLPPHLAPIQVVIIPIYRSEEQLAQISEKVNGIVAKLKALGISVKFDDATTRSRDGSSPNTN